LSSAALRVFSSAASARSEASRRAASWWAFGGGDLGQLYGGIEFALMPGAHTGFDLMLECV